MRSIAEQREQLVAGVQCNVMGSYFLDFTGLKTDERHPDPAIEPCSIG